MKSTNLANQIELPFPAALTERYQVLQLIARGGYAHVFKAVHRERREKVAIKCIVNIFHDCVDGKRILREVVLNQQLKHPCIARLLDFYIGCGSDQQQHSGTLSEDQLFSTFSCAFLIFEYVPSHLGLITRNFWQRSENVVQQEQNGAEVSQQQPAKKAKTLSIEQVAFILSQLLRVLRYLHGVGVVHRDIKPENVLIDRHCHVKVIDFGLSKTIYANSNGSSERQQNDREKRLRQEDSMAMQEEQNITTNAFFTHHIGSRWYRAPEIILNNRTYDTRIDVWSLACVFAELLSLTHVDSKKSQLFPGNSCYPLSPMRRHVPDQEGNLNSGHHIVVYDPLDQLCLIVQHLGTKHCLQDVDKFVQKPSTQQFVLQFTKQIDWDEGLDLATLYPGANRQALDLLQQMLTFNYLKRPTSEQCLKHPFVRDYDSQDEERAWREQYVTLDFDIHYRFSPTTLQESGLFLDEEDLRLLFLREYNKFHPSTLYLSKYEPYVNALLEGIEQIRTQNGFQRDLEVPQRNSLSTVLSHMHLHPRKN